MRTMGAIDLMTSVLLKLDIAVERSAFADPDVGYMQADGAGTGAGVADSRFALMRLLDELGIKVRARTDSCEVAQTGCMH